MVKKIYSVKITWHPWHVSHSHKLSKIHHLTVRLHVFMPHGGDALAPYERAHLGNAHFEIVFRTLNLHNFWSTTPFFANFIPLESYRRELWNYIALLIYFEKKNISDFYKPYSWQTKSNFHKSSFVKFEENFTCHVSCLTMILWFSFRIKTELSLNGG